MKISIWRGVLPALGIVLLLPFAFRPAITRTPAQQAVGNTRACDEKKAYLESKYQARVSASKLLKAAQRDRPQVIFLAERHKDLEVHARQPGLIHELKEGDPELDCLFIEAHSAHQDEINRYMRGAATYEDSVGKWQGGNDRPLLFARKKTLDQADADGIQVIAVDMKSNDLNTRNKYMAKMIRKAFASGECHHAIMIVGKFHVAQFALESSPNRDTPIPKQLRAQGISSYLINLTESVTDESSEKCRDLPDQPEGEFAFFSPELSPVMNASLMSDFYRDTLFSDFDATLLIPKTGD